MIVRCRTCKENFWARWRNSPGLCPACRATALLCDNCRATITPPIDPAQLEMFTIVFRRPTVIESPSLEERYWSLRAKASQKTRRKYPYC